MQNAERNPTQTQQSDMAARSPVKTPAAGAAAPDAATQAREFNATSTHAATPRKVKGKAVLPRIGLPPREPDDTQRA